MRKHEDIAKARRDALTPQFVDAVSRAHKAGLVTLTEARKLLGLPEEVPPELTPTSPIPFGSGPPILSDFGDPPNTEETD